MSAPEVVLELEGVAKRFRAGKREVAALRGVSLRMRAGLVMGLVGPDGAGKTTLMRLVAGLLAPDAGRITVLGLDATSRSLDVQAALGYMPQRFGLYEDLSVQENLDLYADLQGVPRAARAARYAELMQMTGLGPFSGRLAGRLSGGMKQKLGLACTLVRAPPLLLLDEPTVGVDPVSRRELWAIVYRLVKGEGTSVLLSHGVPGRGRALRRGGAAARGRGAGAGTARGARRARARAQLHAARARRRPTAVAGSARTPAGGDRRADPRRGGALRHRERGAAGRHCRAARRARSAALRGRFRVLAARAARGPGPRGARGRRRRRGSAGGRSGDRRARRAAQVRRFLRRPRRELRGAPRRDLRPAGRQRRGQVDHLPHAVRAAAGERGARCAWPASTCAARPRRRARASATCRRSSPCTAT